MKKNSSFVISISRELGSGGAFVGQQLARKLGVAYADREIIRKAAEQLSVLEEDLETREEAVPSFWRSLMQTSGITPDVYVPPKVLLPTNRELFEAESGIIEHIAREGSAVIIGRCGFHVLMEHQNHVSIFLHGDRGFRAERFQTLYQTTRETAETAIAKSDKDRALYCRTYTGKDWSDARNFNLSIDTSKLDGMDKVVDLILGYLKLR